MLFFVSFSNGRFSWATGPLFLLIPALLNSGILGAIISAAVRAQWLVYSVVAALLLAAALIPQQRQQVLRRATNLGAVIQSLMFGLHGTQQRAQPHAANTPQQHQQAFQDGNFDQVVACLQKLPMVDYLSPDGLRVLSTSQLKARLRQLGLSAEGALEKGELLQRLQAAGGSSADGCSICCDGYSGGDVLRVLGCGHVFHVECVDRWFFSVAGKPQRQAACPLCNTPLLPPPERLQQPAGR